MYGKAGRSGLRRDRQVRLSGVTGRHRNTTVAPGVSPAIVVFAGRVLGAATHVLPPSVLYCHSYEARRAAELVTRCAEPDTVPTLAANARGGRTGVFFTARSALWIVEGEFSTLASALRPECSS